MRKNAKSLNRCMLIPCVENIINLIIKEITARIREIRAGIREIRARIKEIRARN